MKTSVWIAALAGVLVVTWFATGGQASSQADSSPPVSSAAGPLPYAVYAPLMTRSFSPAGSATPGAPATPAATTTPVGAGTATGAATPTPTSTSGPATSPTASTTATPATGSALPPQLVGTWTNGSVSPIGFYDPGTGNWGQPSGTGSYYIFSSNGAVEYAGLLQSTLYNCTMSIFMYKTGGASVSGATLAVSFTDGVVESKDNCNASFNYRRPITPTVESYAWRIAYDEFGWERLYLTSADGLEVSWVHQGAATATPSPTATSTPTPAATATGTATASAPVPAGLIGTWRAGAVSSVGFYAPATDAWADPIADGEFFTFDSGAAFTHGRYISETTGACTQRLWLYRTGTLTATVGTLELGTAAGRVRLIDACTPANDLDTTYPPGTENVTWSIAPAAGGVSTLTLTFADGRSQSYAPE